MNANATSVEQLNRQGLKQHLSGHLTEAAYTYRQALQFKAGNATTHNNLGFLLAQTGEIDAALELKLITPWHFVTWR
jgi:Flp pilus assembly protein TadD